MGGNQLASERRSRFQHGLFLLLDINRVVFTGELRQLRLSVVKVLLYRLEALFQEGALAMRRGGRKPRYKTIKLINVCFRKGRSPFRTPVSDRKCEDATLAIFGDDGVIVQELVSIPDKLYAVRFAQIEPCNQSVFDCTASQDTDKKRAGTLDAKQVASYTANKTASAAGERRQHRKI